MKNAVSFRWALLLILAVPVCSFGQQLKDNAMAPYQTWPRYKSIQAAYAANGNRLLWIGKEAVQQEFIQILHHSAPLGLNEGDYQDAFFKKLHGRTSPEAGLDSVDTDVRFTDAALHFFSEVKAGKKPSFRYEGWADNPGDTALASHLKDCLFAGGLKKWLAALQPATKEYTAVLARLNFYQRCMAAVDFKEEKISAKKVDSTNRPLVLRLWQLGIADSLNPFVTKQELLRQLKRTQVQFDLLNDGLLRPTTLEALNIPLRQRIEELKMALNTFRWLKEVKQHGGVLVLNIPSANFFVYDSGKLVLDSRVIVGKPSTPTPTLTSIITEVVLYPYWTVPNKIAVNELLPSIKKNVGFLAAGNFQVLNKSGKVLNPYSIPWRSLGKGNFPYTIRQSTGCDNALGLVKFNFYNPFTVYLHDTPTKILFSSARRFYSHGCMRVEKPEALAHLLLGSNRLAIDTLTAKGCIYHQSPVGVKVEKPFPVVVLYSTVWYTKEGDLRFHNDVYKKLNFTNTIVYRQ